MENSGQVLPIESPGAKTPKTRSYDAFLCHVSRLDGDLARSMRDELHRLARRPFQLRALRVFVDQASATAGELPAQIEQALSGSRFLIILVRPELVERPWCRQEIRKWFELPSRPLPLLVLTAGPDLLWDEEHRRLAFADGTPLPEELSTQFDREPLWVDLRPYQAATARTDPAWLREIARVAVPVHGLNSVDELLGRDHTEQRRLLRWRNFALVVVSLLALVTSVAAWIASQQRAAAERRARESEGRALAARAFAEATRDPVIALELASQANAIPEATDLPEVRAASVEALERGRLLRRLEPPVGTWGDVRTLVQTLDGERILVVANDRAWLLNSQGSTLAPAISLPGRPLVPRSACASADSAVFLIASGYDFLQGQRITGVTVIERDGNRVRQLGLEHDSIFTAAGCGESAERLWVGDRQGRVFSVAETLVPSGIQSNGPVVALAVSGSEVLAVEADALQEERQLGAFELGPPSGEGQSGPVLGPAALLPTTAALRRGDNALAVATGEGPIQLFSRSGWPSALRRLSTWNGHRGAVRAVLWIGKVLVSGGDDWTVRLWREDGTELTALRGHRASVRGLLWREQQKELWSGGTDGAILVWGLPELSDGTSESVTASVGAFSSVTGRADVADLGKLWRLSVGKAPQRVDMPEGLSVSTLAAGEESTFLAVNELDDLKPSSRLLRFDKEGKITSKAMLPKPDMLLHLQALADGSMLGAGGYREGVLRMSSVAEAMRRFSATAGTENSEVPNACGLYLFSAEGRLQRSVHRAHEDSVLALAVSPSNFESVAYATGGADARVRLWTRGLEPIGKPWSFLSDSDDVMPSVITSLAFSPDGKVLYVGTASGMDAVLADLRTRNLVAVRVATGERLWTLRVAGGDIAEIVTSGNLIALRAERLTPRSTESYIRLLWSNGGWVGPELLKGAPRLLTVRFLPDGNLEVLDESLRRHRLAISASGVSLAVRQRLDPSRRHNQALELATFAERAEKSGDSAKAIEFLSKAIAVEPGSETLLAVRGRLRLETGDAPGALKDYDLAIAKHPFLVTTRLMRSRARYATRDLAGAEKDAEMAVQVAKSYFGRQLPPEGLPPGLIELNAAAASSGENVNRVFFGGALENLAAIRLQLGKVDAALADLEEAFSTGRETPSMFAMRARIRELNGDTVGAELDREKMKSIQASSLSSGERQ